MGTLSEDYAGNTMSLARAKMTRCLMNLTDLTNLDSKKIGAPTSCAVFTDHRSPLKKMINIRHAIFSVVIFFAVKGNLPKSFV